MWLMFLHIAYRTRKWTYVAWAGVYLAGLITWIVLTEPLQPTAVTKDVTDALILAVWVGGLLHGVVISRRVNRASQSVLARTSAPVSWSGIGADWQTTMFPSASRLPAIEVQQGKSLFAVVWLRLGVPMALVFLVLLGLNHSRSGIIGFGIALAVMATIVGIEIPLFVRGVARRQAHLLATAPLGTIFAATASLHSTATGDSRPRGSTAHLRSGILAVGSGGIAFVPAKTGAIDPVALPWSTISRLTARPAPNAPLAARLDASLVSGSQVVWTVRGYEGLAKALNDLRGDAPIR